MKILQLGKAYPPVNLGGVEVVIQLLTEGLNNEQIQCDALGVNDKFAYSEDDGKYGGKIFRTKLIAKKFSTLLSFQLVRVLARIWRNYDIIHLHTPDPMAALAIFVVRPRTKIVLHWHSDILKQKIIYFFFKPLLNWIAKRADAIIATSPNYVDDSFFLKKYNEKVVIVPIGIDVDVRPNSSINHNLAKLYDNRTIIFSLGRLAYYKGFEYLVQASKYLPESIVIVIAGEGIERLKLEKIIEIGDLANKVKLVGKISEIDKRWYFNNARLFALSSIVKTEAYAIVQVEAMAYGLPIVSTRIKGSGVDWVNQHQVTGITVPVENAEAIANAIMEIDRDEVQYEAYQVNARERYRTKFTQKIMITQIIGIYERLVYVD